MSANGDRWELGRREFLRSAAGAGTAVVFASAGLGVDKPGDEVEPINVALIGAGAQGEVLLTACLKIPGVRFQAVCDIWESFNLTRASRLRLKDKIGRAHV